MLSRWQNKYGVYVCLFVCKYRLQRTYMYLHLQQLQHAVEDLKIHFCFGLSLPSECVTFRSASSKCCHSGAEGQEWLRLCWCVCVYISWRQYLVLLLNFYGQSVLAGLGVWLFLLCFLPFAFVYAWMRFPTLLLNLIYASALVPLRFRAFCVDFFRQFEHSYSYLRELLCFALFLWNISRIYFITFHTILLFTNIFIFTKYY